MSVEGTQFALVYRGQAQRVHTPHLGRYNVSNHLAAAGLCLAGGLDLEAVAAGLSSLKAIPGRLEKPTPADPTSPPAYAGWSTR